MMSSVWWKSVAKNTGNGEIQPSNIKDVAEAFTPSWCYSPTREYEAPCGRFNERNLMFYAWQSVGISGVPVLFESPLHSRMENMKHSWIINQLYFTSAVNASALSNSCLNIIRPSRKKQQKE
jgi:hypothetical protein